MENAIVCVSGLIGLSDPDVKCHLNLSQFPQCSISSSHVRIESTIGVRQLSTCRSVSIYYVPNSSYIFAV